MQKSITKKLIFIVLIALLMLLLIACQNETLSPAKENPNVLTVTYLTDGNGYINGVTRPISIMKGQDLFKVTAKANEGYQFLEWSDGNKNETRQELNVQENLTFTAYFERIVFEVEYKSGANGTVKGELKQSLFYGEDATSVTAIPDIGYMFKSWSDGVKEATRHDIDVERRINVTANFEKLTKTFTYEYANATGNNGARNKAVTYENFYENSFIIPKKEHSIFGGWYLDYERQIQVSDEFGKITMGYEIFDIDNTCLYAKWTAEEEITYKILMVFVTEVHATLEVRNSTPFEANYVMSDIERQICELIPGVLLGYLNDWFYGLVNFEIDTYFTTIPLGNEAFTSGLTSSYQFSYSIFANKIPEVKGILGNYRSVITTFGMNDYEYVAHDAAGSAIAKYATSHIEAIFDNMLLNDIPFETLLDLNNPEWAQLAAHYLHEFTHTAEQYYHYTEIYEFHAAAVSISDHVLRVEQAKMYLLKQIVIDGEKVGIPFSYWQGEIYLNVSYHSSYKSVILIDGEEYKIHANQTVLFGQDAKEVTIIPEEGYRFVMWSDGVTTPTRYDKNIVEHMLYEAIIEKIEDVKKILI